MVYWGIRFKPPIKTTGERTNRSLPKPTETKRKTTKLSLWLNYLKVLPVKLFQNKTTMSEDKHIELPKQLDLNGKRTITVTGELEKSHIVAQS